MSNKNGTVRLLRGKLIIHVGMMNDERRGLTTLGPSYIPSLAIRWKGMRKTAITKDIRVSRNGVRLRGFKVAK